MMMLPENLSPTLYPMAWLLGEWQGWGTAPSMEPDADDRTLLMQLSCVATGKAMNHTLRVWYASVTQPLDVTAAAAAGVQALTRGEEAWTETGNWELNHSIPATSDTEGLGEGICQLHGGRFGGSGQWAFRTQGPRLMARAASLQDVVDDTVRIVTQTRMYGLVGGELMWAEDSARNGATASPSVTARMARIDQ